MNVAGNIANAEMYHRHPDTKSPYGWRISSKYSRLKTRVIREFGRKKLVGDIIVDDEEYELLVEYMRLFYVAVNHGKPYDCDRMVAVALVQIGIRFYDGSYWNHVAKALGFDVLSFTDQKRLGELAIDTLRNYGRQVPDDADNVRAILSHGFVSKYYADNLFDFLYAYYSIDLQKDLQNNDKKAMAALLEAIQRNDNRERTYKLRAMTSYSVSINPNGARPRIRWLLKMIDAWNWQEPFAAGSENRLVHYFNRWAEKKERPDSSVQGRSPSHGNRQYSSPTLHLKRSREGTSFTILLPPQLVRAKGDAAWYCEIGEMSREVITEALSEAVTGYLTDRIVLDVPKDLLFEKMSFTLVCEKQKKPFRIDRTAVRFFDEEGVGVSFDRLNVGHYDVFSREKEAVSTSGDLLEQYHSGEFWYSFIELEEGNNIALSDGSGKLIGSKTEIGLQKHGMVEGVSCVFGEGQTSVVYSHAPAVLIQIPQEAFAGTAVVLNGKKKRLSDIPRLIHFDPQDGSGKTDYYFVTTAICQKGGIYDLSFDVPNDRSVRRYIFALVPALEFSFVDSPYFFAPSGAIRIKAETELEIADEGVSVETDKDELICSFTITPRREALSVKAPALDLTLSIPIPQFSYRFSDDGEWQTGEPKDVWYSHFPVMLFLRLPADHVYLRLDTMEPEEARVYHKTISSRTVACDLTPFLSYLDRKIEKNTLFISLDNENELPFLTVVTQSHVLRSQIVFSEDHREITLICDVMGGAEYYADVLFGDNVLAERIPIGTADDRPLIHCDPRSGVYKLKIFEFDDSDPFADYTQLGEDISVTIFDVHDLTGMEARIHAVRIVDNYRNVNEYRFDEIRHPLIVTQLSPCEDEADTYLGMLQDRGEENVPGIPVRFTLLNSDLMNRAKIEYMEDKDSFISLMRDNREKTLVSNEPPDLPKDIARIRYVTLDAYDVDEFVISIIAPVEDN